MRILITTDGSDFSRAAVEKCCELVVRPEDTSIKIVSVYEIIVPVDIYPTDTEFAQELERSAHEQATEFAESATAMIREYFPNAAIDLSTQISLGAPERVVVETAEEWKADLIVVGSHGRGFWGRMLLGSVTDSLVHHAPCSVLVVRKPKGENV